MEPGIVRQSGFVWLALPRADVLPLQLLERKKGNLVDRITGQIFQKKNDADVINADIFSLFPRPSSGLVPGISGPRPCAFFHGYDILDIKSAADMNSTGQIPLLGNVRIESNLKVASKLLYSFTNVTQLVVDTEVLLEEHLNLTKVNTNAPGFVDKLTKGNIFVVTDVLQTTEFTISTASDFVFDSSLSADAIDNYVKLKANYKQENEKNHVKSYKSDQPITFALKASKIIYNAKSKCFTLSKTAVKYVKTDSAIDHDPLSKYSAIIYFSD